MDENGQYKAKPYYFKGRPLSKSHRLSVRIVLDMFIATIDRYGVTYNAMNRVNIMPIMEKYAYETVFHSYGGRLRDIREIPYEQLDDFCIHDTFRQLLRKLRYRQVIIKRKWPYFVLGIRYHRLLVNTPPEHWIYVISKRLAEKQGT